MRTLLSLRPGCLYGRSAPIVRWDALLLAAFFLLLLYSGAVSAQVDSTDIVYEQTTPPVWNQSDISVTSGLPEEAPPEQEAASDVSITSRDNVQETPRDFYDNDDYYHEDYPPPPRLTETTIAIENQSRSRGEAYRLDEAQLLAAFSLLPSHVWATLGGLLILGTVLLLLSRMLRRNTLIASDTTASWPGKVVGEVPLSADASLYLIQAGKRILVVGATKESVSLITELSSEDLPVQQPDSDTENTGIKIPTATALKLSKNFEDKWGISDTDIDALRNDLQQLQRSIEELRNKTS